MIGVGEVEEATHDLDLRTEGKSMHRGSMDEAMKQDHMVQADQAGQEDQETGEVRGLENDLVEEELGLQVKTNDREEGLDQAIA